MCLIVHVPAGKTVEDSWLRNFHQRNSDGYGFMWAENGKLKIYKRLADADHFVEDWKRFVDFERVVHLRMRTHGAIDLLNCHPYIVQTSPTGIAMMHNGVLSIGNQSDQTKSDTWHYIERFLKPMLHMHPELLHEPAFQGLVESHIGNNNKFVMMDHTGKVVILNREAGVEWDGMWLSNRYAWDYNRAFPTPPYTGYQGYSRVIHSPSYGSYNNSQASPTDTQQSSQKPNENDKSDSAANSGSPNVYRLRNSFTDQLDLDLINDLLKNCGFIRAANVRDHTYHRLWRRIGEDSFYELLDLLLDHELDEDDFMDCLMQCRLPAAKERRVGFIPPE